MKIEGCTPEEIEQVKLAQGVDFLPNLYQQFLLEMGHAAGHFYMGSHYTIKHLPKLKGWAKELLARDAPLFQLPDDAFVFMMHGGYFFLYFLTAAHEDDPPVYAYQENMEKPALYGEKLSDAFNAEIDDLVRLEEYERQKQLEQMRHNNPNMQ